MAILVFSALTLPVSEPTLVHNVGQRGDRRGPRRLPLQAFSETYENLFFFLYDASSSGGSGRVKIGPDHVGPLGPEITRQIMDLNSEFWQIWRFDYTQLAVHTKL